MGAGGIDDLGNLASFVGGDAWLERIGWRAAADAYRARRPHGAPAVVAALRGRFWRQTKKDVGCEVTLPVQHGHLESIRLSPAE